MSGNDDARTFLESVAGFTDDVDGPDRSSADRPVKLGTIDALWNGTGNPKVLFDGETLMGVRTYPWVGRRPVPGERAMLAPQGHTYIIVGTLGDRQSGIYPSVAVMNATSAPAGSTAYVTATGEVYVSSGSGWLLRSRPRTTITPDSWFNWATQGNSTISLSGWVSDGVAFFELDVTLGSSGSAWTDLGVNLPSAWLRRAAPPMDGDIVGAVAIYDLSAGVRRNGVVTQASFSARNAYFRLHAVSSTAPTTLIGVVGASTLATPATGDMVSARWNWPIAGGVAA